MGLLAKLSQLKILKIIPSRLVQLLWSNLAQIYNFSLRKKYNRMTIGKVFLLFLLALLHQVKVSIR
jgi:hypothetical protein